MKAHLVTSRQNPPRLFTVATEARGYAVELDHGQPQAIEIPDTKADLVPWLNDLLFRTYQNGSGDGALGEREAAEARRREEMLTAHAPPASPEERAGPLQASRHQTPEGAALAAASWTLTAIEEQIHAADGWMLSNILSAAISRLGELKREAAKLGGQA